MGLQIKLHEFIVFIHVYVVYAVSYLHTERCQQQIRSCWAMLQPRPRQFQSPHSIAFIPSRQCIWLFTRTRRSSPKF